MTPVTCAEKPGLISKPSDEAFPTPFPNFPVEMFWKYKNTCQNIDLDLLPLSFCVCDVPGPCAWMFICAQQVVLSHISFCMSQINEIYSLQSLIVSKFVVLPSENNRGREHCSQSMLGTGRIQHFLSSSRQSQQQQCSICYPLLLNEMRSLSDASTHQLWRILNSLSWDLC